MTNDVATGATMIDRAMVLLTGEHRWRNLKMLHYRFFHSGAQVVGF